MPPDVETAEEIDTRTDAEQDADLDAGFGLVAPTDTPPADTEVEPEPEGTPEPEVTPEIDPATAPAAKLAELTEEQLTDLVNKAKKVEVLEATVEKLSGTAFGKIGGLERTLREIQDRTPAGQAVQLTESDFAEMQEHFPELVKDTVSGFNRALARVQVKGTADPEEFNRKVSEAVSARVTAEVPTIVKTVKETTVLEVMDGLVPDWRTVTHSPEYHAWLGTQPPEYKTKILDSWSIADVQESIKKFREHKPTPPATKPAAPPRRDRFKAAVTPKGTGGGGPTVSSEDDALVAGFKRASGT